MPKVTGVAGIFLKGPAPTVVRNLNGIRVYSPVRKCIYCRATTYSPQRDKLGKEHVIPLALDGQIILREASCQACEKVINEFEGPLLRSTFRPLRFLLKLPTRGKNASRPVKPVFVPDENGDIVLPSGQRGRLIDIPLMDYPFSVELPVLPPCFMLSEPQGEKQVKWQTLSIPSNVELMKTKYNFRTVVIEGMDNTHFIRLLAKIAHAYAVAIVGLENLFPYLIDIIRGDLRRTSWFIGGPDYDTRQANALWAMRPTCIAFEGKLHLVVRIELFASFKAPVYHVVAGGLHSAHGVPAHGPLEWPEPHPSK